MDQQQQPPTPPPQSEQQEWNEEELEYRELIGERNWARLLLQLYQGTNVYKKDALSRRFERRLSNIERDMRVLGRSFSKDGRGHIVKLGN